MMSGGSSNLQRQVIHRHQDLGRAKAESARQAALRLDPQANLTAVVDKLTRHNAWNCSPPTTWCWTGPTTSPPVTCPMTPRS